jgi:hypothetical protein
MSSNRLADLLGEAVTGVETGGTLEAPLRAPQKQGSTVTSVPRAASNLESGAPTSVTLADSPGDESSDAFGITYKRVALPGSKPAAGYSLPAGPAFAGERELEREAEENADINQYLVSSLGGKAPADADEFGGDDEFGDAAEASKPLSVATAKSPVGTTGMRVFSSDGIDVPAETVPASAASAASATGSGSSAPPTRSAAMRGNLVFATPAAPGAAASSKDPASTSADPSASVSGVNAVAAGSQALQAVRAGIAAEAERERREELADIERRLLGAGSLAAAAPLTTVAGDSADGSGAASAAATVRTQNKMASVQEGDEDDEEEDEEDGGVDADKRCRDNKQASPRHTAAAINVTASSSPSAPAAQSQPSSASVSGLCPVPGPVPPYSAPESSAVPAASIRPPQPPPRVVMVSEADFEESQRAAAAADFDAASAAAEAARRAPLSSTAGSPAVPELLYSDAAASLLSSTAAAPHRATIVPVASDPDRSCLARLFAPQLAAPLRDERDRIFCCAKQQYAVGDALHVRTMDALHRALTGTAARGDWTAIGFQRPEGFETDLRGAGMLGPLNMLWLAQRHGAVSAIGGGDVVSSVGQSFCGLP